MLLVQLVAGDSSPTAMERDPGTMGATLEALHRLQEIELQIAEINRGIERKLRVVHRHQHLIADLDKKISAHQAALRTEQMETDRLDVDVKAREAEIAKYRQALNLAKTNKEYSAILTQLNTNKADMSKVEERVLALLNQVEAKRAEIKVIQDDRAREAAKLEEYEAAVEKARKDAMGRLTSLHSQRDLAAAAVPPTALQCFDRIAKKNDGEAMARVIRTHPKRAEFACQGCNMSITIEQVNAVMSRDEAITCNICGRILFMESTVGAS
jgi:predicted  nucleic acid-binding Zn-ribbon protein